MWSSSLTVRRDMNESNGNGDTLHTERQPTVGNFTRPLSQ